MKHTHNILKVPIFNIDIIVHIGDIDSLKKELCSSFGNEKGNEVFKEMQFSDEIKLENLLNFQQVRYFYGYLT